MAFAPPPRSSALPSRRDGHTRDAPTKTSSLRHKSANIPSSSASSQSPSPASPPAPSTPTLSRIPSRTRLLSNANSTQAQAPSLSPSSPNPSSSSSGPRLRTSSTTASSSSLRIRKPIVTEPIYEGSATLRPSPARVVRTSNPNSTSPTSPSIANHSIRPDGMPQTQCAVSSS